MNSFFPKGNLMVDHAKLFICSGMLLIFLGAGCASTGSQRNSVASFDSQSSTLPSRKRMVVIAKTYEEQGHKQRAVTTYRQLLKRYPKTEQGKFARGRILALNGPDEQKKNSDSPEETMLANSASKQIAPAEVKQPETKKEQVNKETLVEAPFPDLPLPEQLAEGSENNSAKLIVNNDSNDSKVSDSSKPAENSLDENAKWPEWSGSKLASIEPKIELMEEPVGYPTINPVLSRHSKKEHKGELLLPPAVLLTETSLEQITEKQEANLNNEDPNTLPEVIDLSWKGRQTETVKKEDGWVTSSSETVSIPEVIIEAESETTLEVDTEKQNQINHRLASLAYLIGNEKFVAEDTLDSLKLLLDHDNQHVRINSAEALFRHQHGSEKALQAITSAFSSTDESIRFIAVHALVSAYEQSPEETIQVMVAQLDTDSTSVQRQIALLLGDFQGHSSTLIPRLQQLVDEHPDEEVREAALLSLVCLKE